MSKFAKNSWKMNKINGSSVTSSDTSLVSVEEEIPAHAVVAEDITQEVTAEPCIQWAKHKACTLGENCKLDHQRKLCRSFLMKGECSFESNTGRKCYFEHFQEICEEFQRRGKCGFEKRTERKCIKKHERPSLYKNGITFA